MEATFLGLSRLLTGEEHLDEQLATEYHDRLHAQYPAPLDGLVQAFSEVSNDPDVSASLRQRLDADASVAVMARETIKIWFTSQFTRPDGRTDTGPAKHWNASLLWKVIHAPVPATGPYPYGFWADSPEGDLADGEGRSRRGVRL
jgi:hypothetical protein